MCCRLSDVIRARRSWPAARYLRMSPADATGLVGSRDVDALPPPLLPLLSLVRLPVPALPRAAEFRAPDPVQLPLPFSKPLAAAEDEADEELLDCRRPPELPPLLPLTVPAPLITLALPAAALGAPGPIRLPLPFFDAISSRS